VRNIDADALLSLMNDVKDFSTLDFNDAIEMVGLAPTVDVVAVVRCGDCMHSTRDGWWEYSGQSDHFRHCTRVGNCQSLTMPVDGYCSYGETN
jgi:hypothetical protein